MALTNKLTAIGDAIRYKTGTTELLTLDDMPTAIRSIETGGDAPTVKLTELSVTANGTYTPTDSDGFSKVFVNVEGGEDVFNSLWENGTWEEISEVLTSYYNGEITDLSPYFRIGDKRDISTSAISAYGGNTSGNYKCEARDARTMPWVIIGIKHDDLETPTDAGVTKTAITIIPYYNYEGAVYWNKEYNSTYNSVFTPNTASIWGASQANAWLHNMFLPAIEESCRNLIKPVVKKTARPAPSDYTAYDVIHTSVNSVWLLSYYEVSGIEMSAGADGEQYEWFKNDGEDNIVNKIRYKDEEAKQKISYHNWAYRNGIINKNGSSFSGYCYYQNSLSLSSSYGTSNSSCGACMGMCL